MNDEPIDQWPPARAALTAETVAIGFTMASETRTGALLATLAATKPGGRLLELGTGTGLATSWLLAGMDVRARLDSVDTDPGTMAVARRHLGGDPRLHLHLADAVTFVQQASRDSYDVIFADAWPGKFSHLDDTLALLKPGGLYVIDDLLPQANWPDGHALKVPALIADLQRRTDFTTVTLAWASGIMMAVRR